MWITYPGIKPAMDSPCQMPREYWMHSNAAHSLAALERCYTIFFVLANHPQDVRNITHVFNYDYPNNSEDYIHRIGRTGRAGAKGTAITLFTTDSMFHLSPFRQDVLTIL